MARVAWDNILHYIRRLSVVEGCSNINDVTLLRRFAANRDEIAFMAIVGRHGPMVWGVCRRVLSHIVDAEDAFQATFLVLVRKAKSIRRPELLGAWLHGVARRVAVKRRSTMFRQQTKEQPLADLPAAETVFDVDRNELRLLLDEEINRLPNRYRVPFILCHLEGLTNEEAAQRIGCPKGTVLSRLSRARERLRKRLIRRGISLTSAALTAALTETVSALPVPATLSTATVQLGLSFASGAVPALTATSTIALAEGVLTNMFLANLKLASALLLTLGLIGAGGGYFIKSGVDATKPQPKVPPADREMLIGEEHAAARPSQGGLLIRDKLNSIVKFNGIDDPKETLSDALALLASKYDVQFDVNEKAFKFENIPDVLKTEIASPNPMPAMNASLSTVLRKILYRINIGSGATYLIRENYIEITTGEAVQWELNIVTKDQTDSNECIGIGTLPPHITHYREPLLTSLVYDDFEKKPLLNALYQIARSAGVNLVVDPGIPDDSKNIKVSARFHNVLPEIAFQVLANAGNLAMEHPGNVYYITTLEKAKRLNAERLDKKPPPDVPPKKDVPPPPKADTQKGNQGLKELR